MQAKDELPIPTQATEHALGHSRSQGSFGNAQAQCHSGKDEPDGFAGEALKSGFKREDFEKRKDCEDEDGGVGNRNGFKGPENNGERGESERHAGRYAEVTWEEKNKQCQRGAEDEADGLRTGHISRLFLGVYA